MAAGSETRGNDYGEEALAESTGTRTEDTSPVAGGATCRMIPPA